MNLHKEIIFGKKRRLLIIAIFILTVVSDLFAQSWIYYDDTTELFKQNHVKELRVFNYTKKKKDSSLSCIVRYNIIGKIISYTSFSFDNTINTFDTFVYNNEKLISRHSLYGLKVKEDDTLIYNNEGLLVAQLVQSSLVGEKTFSTNMNVTFQYNHLDKLYKSETYINDTLSFQFVILYNQFKQPSLRHVIFRTEKKYDTLQIKYTYNSFGQVTQQETLSTINGTGLKAIEYNNNQKIIKEISKSTDYDIILTNRYNKQGNKIETKKIQLYKNRNLSNTETNYSYYLNNLVFETKYFLNGQIYNRQKNFYNYY
jgi:hypothetical protein